jgi:hypothetical protein
MNDFIGAQGPIQMAGHHEAMLKDIAVLAHHRGEVGLRGRYSYSDIASAESPAALPVSIFGASAPSHGTGMAHATALPYMPKRFKDSGMSRVAAGQVNRYPACCFVPARPANDGAVCAVLVRRAPRGAPATAILTNTRSAASANIASILIANTPTIAAGRAYSNGSAALLVGNAVVDKCHSVIDKGSYYFLHTTIIPQRESMSSARRWTAPSLTGQGVLC